MTEDEELEEELRRLDVKEDYGEEDSDVTPTNNQTPPIPPTVLFMPHSSNTSGYYEGDCTRYSSGDETDLRSNSSLSWGEDEFEGEATRIVSGLFNQIDEIVYEDSSDMVAKFPLVDSWKKRKRKRQIKDDEHSHQEESSFELSYSLEAYSSEEDLNTLPYKKNVDVPSPSPALLNECREWMDNFPHIRVCGVGINVMRYERIFSELLEDKSFDEETGKGYDGEVILMEGNYKEKLGLMSLNSVPEKVKKSEKKMKGPPSRICSGSDDPVVLKEHILIKLFDHLWPMVSQIIEPLLSKYSESVINGSLQLSSFSRESSSRSERAFPVLRSEELGKHLLPHAFDSVSSLRTRDRPISNLRPSSASYRLQQNGSMRVDSGRSESSFESVSYDRFELSDEGRSLGPFRTIITEGSFNLPFLPSTVSRPLSSKAGKRFLTPMPTSERRPLTTSSFIRSRNNGVLNRLDSPATVIENTRPSTMSSETRRGVLNRSWSRHDSFLPMINNRKTKNSNSPNIMWDISKNHHS